MRGSELKDSVTAVFTHRIYPGKEVEYEQWVKGISQAAATFEGYAGISVLRPSKGDRAEYVSILRFDHYHNLKIWMESDIRQEWLANAKALTQADLHTQTLTGLEAWFTLPGQPVRSPPPRYKMAILTWISVYGLLMLLGFTLAPLLATLPSFIRTLIISAIMVILITYVVMPRLTRLSAKWLFKPDRE